MRTRYREDVAKPPKIPTTGGDALKSHPFAALGKLGVELSEGPVQAAPAPPEPEAVALPAPGSLAGSGKILVRREKKGRGGKTATIVEGIAGNESALDEVLRELQKSLACGGHRDGSNLVLAGAQGERVVAWLRQRGARKVVLGS